MSLTDQQEDCTGPALVPGALRGYRSWNMHSYGIGKPSPLNLYALTGPPWEKVTTARCLRGERLVPCECDKCMAVAPAPQHEAPHAGCKCGIYGYYAPEFVQSDAMPMGMGYLGVIEATGRTLVGTKGFRTQRARVVALAPWVNALTLESNWADIMHDLMPTTLQTLREAGIAVYATFQDVLNDFPPDDYASMLANLKEGTDDH